MQNNIQNKTGTSNDIHITFVIPMVMDADATTVSKTENKINAASIFCVN